eukprot:851421_1
MEKTFEYSGTNQTIALGSRIQPSLPLQLKKLDLDLEWQHDNALPKGIQLNEHTGTIYGRVEPEADVGTFNYTITAGKHELKWTATFSITIIQEPIKRLEYPNANVSILTRHEKIKVPIRPVVEGSVPHSFVINPCEPYSGDMPNGLQFDTTLGTFSGCPTEISKSSWKVTATNLQNTLDSEIIVVDIRRSRYELDEPKQCFDIPRKMFQSVDLQVAFDTFKSNDTGKLSLDETANILRACGKTPTPSQMKRVFDKYCDGNTFVTLDQMKAMMNEPFYEVNLKEIQKVFQSIDRDKTGKISIKQFRKLMRSGEGVQESVIDDICKTVDDKNEGFIEYHAVLDLYSRISHGVRFEK